MTQSEYPPPYEGGREPHEGYGRGGGYDQGGEYGQGGGYDRVVEPKNGLGTAALVVGILALLATLSVVLSPVGVVLGIIAIVLGVLGRKRVKRRTATNGGAALTGLILGVISLLLGLILIATIGSFLVSFSDEIGSAVECQQQNAGDQAAIDQCVQDLQESVEQQAP